MSTIHNPEQVASPGDGYRFLTKKEVQKRRDKGVSNHIETWHYDCWYLHGTGSLSSATYRTKLTEEELEREG